MKNMKNMKQYLLFALLFIGLKSYARWNDGMIRIREDKGRSISVSIDGIRFDKIGRTVTIPNVNPGKHRIKVIVYNINGYGYRNGTIMYEGDVFIKPQTILYGTVFEKAIDIEEYCCVDRYGNWNNNDNWDNWETETQTWNNNHRWSEKNRDQLQNRNLQRKEWNTYQGSLSIGRYNELINQIRNSGFESSKVDLIQTALINTSVTTEQLLGILKELSFESSKLEISKKIHPQLSDKNNAFRILNEFTFQSSKDEYRDFLNRNR